MAEARQDGLQAQNIPVDREFLGRRPQTARVAQWRHCEAAIASRAGDRDAQVAGWNALRSQIVQRSGS